MIKKRITYTDYNGNERTEDFWFNITLAEAAEMEMCADGGGGISNMIRRVVESKDMPSIVNVFKDFVLKAYGEKTPDGKRFMKSEEISKAFSETEAYSILFMELATDAAKAAAFVNGVFPNKKPQLEMIGTEEKIKE